MIYLYHYYEFPKPTGRYKAGYQATKHGNVLLSVFYPTEETNKPLAKFIHSKNHLDNYYSIASFFVRGLPRFLFDLLNDYTAKLVMNAYEGATIVSPNDSSFESADKKFIPIIFSHGLGGFSNVYSAICNELASHGYIVFSIDHSDDIVGIFKDRTGETGKKYLAKRVSECKEFFDGLEKSRLLEDLFNQQVPLAFDKLTIMGHSYGGATSVMIAEQDTRIKNCVLLDPYFPPLDKIEELKLNCNLLILESDSWDGQAPDLKVRDRNKLLVKSQVLNGKISLYTVVGRSDHASFTDNSLFIGPMLKVSKQITYFSEVEEMTSLISNLIQRYMRIIVEGQPENADSSSRVEKYLEVFKENPNLSFEKI